MVDLSTPENPSPLYYRDTQSQQQDPPDQTQMCLNILTTFACGHTSIDWVPTVPRCDLNLNFHNSPLVQEANPAVCNDCLSEAYDMSWDSDYSFNQNPTLEIEVTPTETPSTHIASGSNNPSFCSLLFTEEDGTIDYDAMGEFPTSPFDHESISETDEPELFTGYHAASESLYLSGQPYDFTETSGAISYELGPVPEPVFTTESLSCLESSADNTAQTRGNISYDGQMLPPLHRVMSSILECVHITGSCCLEPFIDEFHTPGNIAYDGQVLPPLDTAYMSLPDSMRTPKLDCLEPPPVVQTSYKIPHDIRMLRALDKEFDSAPDSARTRRPLHCLEPSVDDGVETRDSVSCDAQALRALDKAFASRH